MPEVLDDDFDPSEVDEAIIKDVRGFLIDQGFKPMKLEAVIYALFLDDICQYIGSTTRLYSRMYEHLQQKRIPFNKILTKRVNEDNMAIEESYLIGILEPPHNLNGTARKQIRLSKSELETQARILLDYLRRKEAK